MFKNFLQVFLLLVIVFLITLPIKSLYAGGCWRPFICNVWEDEDVTPQGLTRVQSLGVGEEEEGKPYRMSRLLTDFERSRMKLPTLRKYDLDPCTSCCDCSPFCCLNNDWSDFCATDKQMVRIMGNKMSRNTVPTWWQNNVDYKAETMGDLAEHECEMPCMLGCIPIALMETLFCPATCCAILLSESRHPTTSSSSFHTPLLTQEPKSMEETEPSLKGGSYSDDLDNRLRSRSALSRWVIENVKDSASASDRNYCAQILTESSITYDMTQDEARKLVNDVRNKRIPGLFCQPKVWKK